MLSSVMLTVISAEAWFAGIMSPDENVHCEDLLVDIFTGKGELVTRSRVTVRVIVSPSVAELLLSWAFSPGISSSRTVIVFVELV